jgi:hypothetical protein
MMMDEQRRRYRELRDVLTQLASSLTAPATLSDPSLELRRVSAYLHSHCGACGAALSDAGTLLVEGQEFTRVGLVPQSEYEDTPICPACYTALRAVRGAYAPGDAPTTE